MAYVGNTPADKTLKLEKQQFTTSATTSYTLSHSVSDPQDIALFINNVRQNPNSSYTVSGTALTLSAATASTDTMYCVFLGRAIGTVGIGAGSVTKDKVDFISDGTGSGVISKGDGSSIDGSIQLNCHVNSHGIKLKSPPHSAGQSYTLTFPQTAPSSGKFIQTDGSGNLSFAGLGNYVIEKIDQYSYGTVVTSSTPANYLDIAGGNTINFTPTSTSDIIFITGLNLLSMGSASDGAGIGIMRATSSSITSSDTVVERTGRHAVHHVGATSNYHIGKIITADTGLSASTTVYYEMFGQLHGSNGVRHFNSSVSNDKESTRHKLIGIHYKYIG